MNSDNCNYCLSIGRAKYGLAVMSLFALLGLSGRLTAQPDGVANDFWAQVEANGQTAATLSALDSLLTEVRDYCGADFSCFNEACNRIMFKLERSFRLGMATYVAAEIVRAANEHQERAAEARAHKTLSTYHDAMGNHRTAALHLSKALALLEQLGDQPGVILAKMNILDRQQGSRDRAAIVADMEALLEEALSGGHKQIVSNLRIRLLLQTQDAGMHDKMEAYVRALEDTPLSDPIRQSEYAVAIHAALGRADLFAIGRQWEKAKLFYQKTLELCEAEPSRWLEVYTLHRLASLEQERGLLEQAKPYLNLAQQKAEKLELHDLLASNFEQQAAIAEAEGRYKEALSLMRKHQEYKKSFEDRGADFDTHVYFLQQEKKELAAEQQRQVQELQLRKNQLVYSGTIIILALLLALGLFIGLYRQRLSKRKMAAQYRLIQQQAEQLQQLDAAKSRFFANVSHELRTPLTLIAGPVSTLLKTGPWRPEQQRLLQAIQQSSGQLGLLVNDILDLRKLEMGKMEVRQEPTPVAAFFRRHFAQFESKAEQQGIAYELRLDVGEGAVADLDPAKCRQMANNLLSNAFKFTPPGGRIEVALSLADGWLELSVADSGAGIPADELARVFDRFFQSSRPEQPAQGGTGIGLALCKEYAELLGGAIKAESQVGEGSTFRIAFPLTGIRTAPLPESPLPMPETAVSTSLAPRGAAEAPAAADPARPTLLVVEDNRDLRAFLRLILSRRYTVLEAEHGQAALHALQAKRDSPGAPPVRLVLSDLMMPVMDGYELLARLKADEATRHLPVVMLTARAEARDKLKALRIGVDDYLTKPFDEEELLARIENLLKHDDGRRAIAATDEAQPPTPDGAGTSAKNDRDWLAGFEAYVQENISSDVLTISYMASHFAMSESSFRRQVSRLTGLSPKQYLQEVRLDLARQLLENRTYRTVAQVADKAGFSNYRTFSRNYKSRFGKSPAEYLSS